MLGVESLKALNTFGGCQRPVFSLGVSQYIMHKISSLWKSGLIWSLKLRENDERKNVIVGFKIVCFQIGMKGILARSILLFEWEITCLFLKNYVTSEGADSQNVSYNQQLSVARYLVWFYADIYFE